MLTGVGPENGELIWREKKKKKEEASELQFMEEASQGLGALNGGKGIGWGTLDGRGKHQREKVSMRGKKAGTVDGKVIFSIYMKWANCRPKKKIGLDRERHRSDNRKWRRGKARNWGGYEKRENKVTRKMVRAV